MATQETENTESTEPTGDTTEETEEAHEEETGERSRPARDGSRGVSGADAAKRAKRQLEQLTGRPPDTVTELRRDDGGGWLVTVEVVELERVPASTDVLGTYEVVLDDDGRLVEYRRIARYYRNQATNQ